MLMGDIILKTPTMKAYAIFVEIHTQADQYFHILYCAKKLAVRNQNQNQNYSVALNKYHFEE